MKFTCTIDMDNAAFEDYPSNELSNIFADIDYKVAGGVKSNPIKDSNGNTVGQWRIEG